MEYWIVLLLLFCLLEFLISAGKQTNVQHVSLDDDDEFSFGKFGEYYNHFKAYFACFSPNLRNLYFWARISNISTSFSFKFDVISENTCIFMLFIYILAKFSVVFIEFCRFSNKKMIIFGYFHVLRTLQPMILDQHYITLKTQVIKAERRVLKELGFCVHIKHPHKIIVMYLQVLSYEKNLALMQLAWNYMNDSLRTDAFVRYQPEVIACACIYLTARKLKLPLPRAPAWYLVFGVSELQIKDVCLKILRLYARPKPNVEALEKKVDELCKQYHDAKIKARAGSENNTPHSGSPSSPGQKISGGTHNAWGGFISRSGSHIVPTNDKQPPRSRSRSASHSPVASKHHKRSKKHTNRSRSRSPAARPHKKSHKRRPSYSRSRSTSPHAKQSRKTGRDKNRHRSRSRSVSYDRDAKADKFHDKYSENNEKKDRYTNDKYISKEDKYSSSKEEKYARDDRDTANKDRYKKTKQERTELRERSSKDRRR